MNVQKDNAISIEQFTPEQLITGVEVIGSINWHNLPSKKTNTLQLALDEMYLAYSKNNMLLEQKKLDDTSVDLNEEVIEAYYYFSKIIKKAMKSKIKVEFND